MYKPLSLWFKLICTILFIGTFLWGLMIKVPALPILNETIRNLFYHVPVWFSMMLLAGIGAWNALQYLIKKEMIFFDNLYAASLMVLLLSIPGLATGMWWARFTWGTWWTFNDPKLNGVAISVLLYAALFLMISGISDRRQKASVASTYNLFAFLMMLLFIMVLPRLTASLHPGNGGNPAFGTYDLDNTMRLVFYPAVMAWMMLGYWLYDLLRKFLCIQKQFSEKRVYF